MGTYLVNVNVFKFIFLAYVVNVNDLIGTYDGGLPGNIIGDDGIAEEVSLVGDTGPLMNEIAVAVFGEDVNSAES